MMNLVHTQTILADRLRFVGHIVLLGLEAKTPEDKHWYLQQVAQYLGLDLPPSLQIAPNSYPATVSEFSTAPIAPF